MTKKKVSRRRKRTVPCDFCRNWFTPIGLKIHCAKVHKLELELVKHNWSVYHGDIDGDSNYW